MTGTCSEGMVAPPGKGSWPCCRYSAVEAEHLEKSSCGLDEEAVLMTVNCWRCSWCGVSLARPTGCM